MCVILVAKATRPTEEMVERAFDHNKDGFGIAWREFQRNAAGEVTLAEVVWKKGVMDVDEAQRLCQDAPLPYTAHFRVASVGGVKPTLTHPFLVDEAASLLLEGRTPGSVLFHNGHWSPWADKALEAAINSDSQIPIGDWSDTRAIAWMVHLYGPGFMELLTTQKGVLMAAKSLAVYTGGDGWKKINDVWCSNDYFWTGRSRSSTHSTVYGKLCSLGRCRDRAEVGGEFCKAHDPATVTAELVDEDSPEMNGNTTAAVPETPLNSLAIITGGGKRPLAEVLSLKEAEGLYQDKLISKGLVKKFRKEYQAMNRGQGQRAERALVTLKKLSNAVADQLLSGSGA